MNFPRLACLLPVAALAAGPAPDFNREIRPILSANCIHCHGPDEHERKGGKHGLRLDTEEGSREDHGGYAALVPGKPGESRLMAHIRSTDPDEVMPPAKSGKKLTAREIDLLERWIASGAKYETHWSYAAPKRPTPPAIAGAKPIDAFVRARLRAEGLEPQPEADRATLARRVALDLTGLPPSVEEVDAFLADKSPTAYETFVDRQLAKPAYGEHWARLWMDLARYADSMGYADDKPRTIWAYRDWIIQAFNRNQPFDQFTIEQLAGDLLPNPTEDQLVATAFHRNTMNNNEGGTNDEEFRSAAVVDRVNTTFGVWMGTSMACAQCHTHKYDPITQKEYFEVYHILNQSQDRDTGDDAPTLPVLSAGQREEKARLEAEIAALETKLGQPTEASRAEAAAWIARLSAPLEWKAAKPVAVESKAGSKGETRPDGAVSVAPGAAADTTKVTLELPAGPLTALRLEVPGTGHNFVLTGVTAALTKEGRQAPLGRFVRVELPGKQRILHLAEVEVFSGGVNVARQGKATQKSTGFGGTPERAIDGNTNGDYDKNSVTHNEIEDDPWWEVDLQADRAVDRIVLWNRTGGDLPGRLDGYRIALLDAKRQVLWEQTGRKGPAKQDEFAMDGVRGVPFAGVSASFEQGGFDADAVINPSPAGKKRKDKNAAEAGWAVAPKQGEAHTLSLFTASPVTVEAGDRLVLTLAQESKYGQHTLREFRVSVTADTRASERTNLPAEVLALLDKTRSAEEEARLAAHHHRDVFAGAAADRAALAALRRKVEEIKPVTVPILRELAEKNRRKTQVHIRGNFQSLGEEVGAGVPSAFHPLPADAPRDRLGLARWLVSRDNPLTARVVMNRLWEQLFGIGIVRTSEEFGAQGDLPVNPALLDWLAVEFMERGWDTRAMIRELVLSATYRQSSRVTAAAREKDPDNQLLSRGPRQRLTAEMVRDQALAVSGLLNPAMYGPPVRPPKPSSGLSAAFGGSLDWKTSDGADRHRRGLYTEWRRTSPYPSMTTFDAPSREVCTLKRNKSNTPLQALVTLNDPVYVEAAQGLARRMVAAGTADEARLTAGFRLCLARAPSAAELTRLRQLLDEARADFAADPARATAFSSDPIGPAPAGIALPELAAWTATANVLLNLDETVMRR